MDTTLIFHCMCSLLTQRDKVIVDNFFCVAEIRGSTGDLSVVNKLEATFSSIQKDTLVCVFI